MSGDIPLSWGMSRPTVFELSDRIITFLADEGIAPNGLFDADWRKSGVYAVLDCVFSSQIRFSVVEKALATFAEKSGLRDTPELTFSGFLAFVRDETDVRPSTERFDWVAEHIFGYRGKISGRTKVEVAYDVCEFFAAKGYETKRDLQALPAGKPFTCTDTGESGELERLVMQGIVNLDGKSPYKVRGMGLALGAYLLMCLGRTDFVKPDTLLLRRVGHIVGRGWQPKSGDEADYLLIRQAISCAAERLGQPAAAVDHALWKYESARS